MKADVIVVGGGPAGSVAARQLALQGLRVVLLEKDMMPRPKVCGGGVVHRARAMLAEAIADPASVVCEECHRAVLTVDGGDSFLAEREVPIVSMVRRASFDAWLAAQAESAGAELRTGKAVEQAELAATHVTLRYGGERIHADFVVAADGANGIMARAVAAPKLRHLAPAIECELPVSEREYERFSGVARFDFGWPAKGYGWVFPKAGRLGIGIGSFGARGTRSNLKQLLPRYVQCLGLRWDERTAVHGYVIPLSPRAGGFARRRVLLVGDAAGLADPLSAEGITAAMHSGLLAARAIAESGGSAEMAGQRYQALLQREILPDLAAAKRLASLFYGLPYARKWLMTHDGARLTERMTDIFMGDARYRDYAARFWSRFAGGLLGEKRG